MRQILFRGLRTDGKGWAYGLPLEDEHGKWYMYASPMIEYPGNHCVIPETICQFTGLTDRNSVKIFEADVDEYNCVVKHYRGCFVLEKENSDSWCLLSDAENFEVTGNIHEGGGK